MVVVVVAIVVVVVVVDVDDDDGSPALDAMLSPASMFMSFMIF